MEIECPYCSFDNNEQDDCFEEDELYEMECVNCLKTFGFSPYYIRRYHTRGLPCKNGESHDWKQIIGHPKKFFRGKRRCSYCGDEKTITTKSGVSKQLK